MLQHSKFQFWYNINRSKFFQSFSMPPPLLRTSFLEKTIFFIFLLGEALSKNMAGARLRAKVVDDEIDTFFFLFVDPSCRLKNDLGWRTQGRTLAFFFSPNLQLSRIFPSLYNLDGIIHVRTGGGKKDCAIDSEIDVMNKHSSESIGYLESK